VSAGLDTPEAPAASITRVVVIGHESVGKSSLLAALSGGLAEPAAFAGSTLHCQSYADEGIEWVDTPGIVSDSDARTVQSALAALESSDSADVVLLVLRAHRAPEEWSALRGLLRGRRVAIVLSHRDRLTLPEVEAHRARLNTWQRQLGVPVQLLDARRPAVEDLGDLRGAVERARPLAKTGSEPLPEFPEASANRGMVLLEKLLGLPPVSLLLLFGPAWVAVTQANRLADALYDGVLGWLEAPLAWLNELPAPIAAILAGDYGVVAMLPFLLLYALPTILIFAGMLAVYKSTGLIDRLSYGLHGWLKPFGLGGRDLVRVVMGFGCNVPAVVATRACSSCSRGACVSAISFGSACSYQLPATLAVFAATGYVWLGPVYLTVLAVTTLIYLRLTTPRALRAAQSRLLLPALGNLRRPDGRGILRDMGQSLRDFANMALPVFVGICFVAGLLQWSGALAVLTLWCAPVMALFRLPPEASLAVVLGSVRKDGLAIGLLDSEWQALKVPMDAPLQVLTAVYLAGVLLPCLVTLLTVAREMRPGFALKMVGRQAGYAVLFSMGIAWGGHLILSNF